MARNALFAGLVVGTALAQVAIGQALTIESFETDAAMTWTNTVNTNARYRIEWASSADGPWHRTWQSLQALEAHTNTEFSASVPRFYRVAMTTAPWPTSMVLVDASTFSMGDHYGVGDGDEEPVHNVHVSAFLMDRYLVTNERMRRVMQWAHDQGLVTATAATVQNMEGTPQELIDLDDPDVQVAFSDGTFSVPAGKENFPCVEITWYGALAYCNFRSDRENLARCINFSDWTCDFSAPGYRLATEAEWEKAARGGLVGHSYPWPSHGGSYSNHIDGSMGNYADSGDPYDNEPLVRTTPVGYYNGGQLPAGDDMANLFGLYDMAGNTREWCWDWYRADWYGQPGASEDDTRGPVTGSMRVHRGGMFDHQPRHLRCANRAAEAPGTAPGYAGFRSVRR